MTELLDRLLGFMPNRSVLWTAVATTIIAFAFQKIHHWFQSIAILPWEKEENQKKRMEILQGKRSKQNQNTN